MAFNKRAVVDILERAGATFAQAAVAVYFVDHGKVSELTAIETAAVAGGLAVVKWVGAWATTYLKTVPPTTPPTTPTA